MINKENGKYIGYLTTLEGSTVVWSDDIEEIKSLWCVGSSVFESSGIDVVKLKSIFPTPPHRGVILDYFKNNLKLVCRDGIMIGELSQEDMRILKIQEMWKDKMNNSK
jgi:hypothetical protein